MPMGFMEDNAMRGHAGQEKFMLVDLGEIKNKAVQERHKKLVEAGVGRKNFMIEGAGRLLMKVPKTKEKKLLEKFPIKEAKTYWQCTHAWKEDTDGKD